MQSEPHKYHDRLLEQAKRSSSSGATPRGAWRLLTSCAPCSRRRRAARAPTSYDEPMTYGQAMRLARTLHGGRVPPVDARVGAGAASSFDEAGVVWCHAPALAANSRPLCCASQAAMADADERPPPPVPEVPRPL